MNAVFAQGGGGGFLIQIIPLGAMFLIFYFLVLVPQRKKQKALEEMLNNLKNGDKVVTQGGIYGTIAGINAKENTVQLQIAASVKVEVARSAITALRNGQDDVKEKI